MKISVKVEDRVTAIEYLRMALSIAEVCVDYPTAELISEVVTAVIQKQGTFSIDDGIILLNKWKRKWEEYFEKQIKEEQK